MSTLTSLPSEIRSSIYAWVICARSPPSKALDVDFSYIHVRDTLALLRTCKCIVEELLSPFSRAFPAGVNRQRGRRGRQIHALRCEQRANLRDVWKLADDGLDIMVPSRAPVRRDDGVQLRAMLFEWLSYNGLSPEGDFAPERPSSSIWSSRGFIASLACTWKMMQEKVFMISIRFIPILI